MVGWFMVFNATFNTISLISWDDLMNIGFYCVFVMWYRLGKIYYICRWNTVISRCDKNSNFTLKVKGNYGMQNFSLERMLSTSTKDLTKKIIWLSIFFYSWFWLIDWCLMLTLAIFQLYRDVLHLGFVTFH
jgi:hypothetical protein